MLAQNIACGLWSNFGIDLRKCDHAERVYTVSLLGYGQVQADKLVSCEYPFLHHIFAWPWFSEPAHTVPHRTHKRNTLE